MRVLASGTRTRQAELPNAPTVEESGGAAGFVVSSWLALYGSPSLPPETARRIAGDIARIMQAPAVNERIRSESLPASGKDLVPTPTVPRSSSWN